MSIRSRTALLLVVTTTFALLCCLLTASFCSARDTQYPSGGDGSKDMPEHMTAGTGDGRDENEGDTNLVPPFAQPQQTLSQDGLEFYTQIEVTEWKQQQCGACKAALEDGLLNMIKEYGCPFKERELLLMCTNIASMYDELCLQTLETKCEPLQARLKEVGYHSSEAENHHQLCAHIGMCHKDRAF